jgi:hypothetical protein
MRIVAVATLGAIGVNVTPGCGPLAERLDRIQYSMTGTYRKFGSRNASALCVLLAAAAGCATTSPAKSSAPPVVAETAPVAKRPVQTIRLEPSDVDGQTSWIIEPDVPRIPKISGLERQLPPHIDQRLSRAFDLAQRGASYSANIEFREVLSLCALELDTRQGVTSHRDAMRQGMVALDEADEITGQNIDWSDAADVRVATAGHTTPVLHGKVPAGADAIQVVQLYYSYAEERFAYACEGLPGASLAYYGLARTFVQPGTRYVHSAGKAAMLQRVALRVAPQNVLAGNELGVLLAQHGHLNEAEALFKQCVATDASPEAWQNLAAVYARKGDAEASRIAMAEGSKLAASQKAVPPMIENSASEIATVASPSTDTLTQTESTNESNVNGDADQQYKHRPSFWSKLALSQKLPSMFRR